MAATASAPPSREVWPAPAALLDRTRTPLAALALIPGRRHVGRREMGHIGQLPKLLASAKAQPPAQAAAGGKQHQGGDSGAGGHAGDGDGGGASGGGGVVGAAAVAAAAFTSAAGGLSMTGIAGGISSGVSDVLAALPLPLPRQKAANLLCGLEAVMLLVRGDVGGWAGVRAGVWVGV
jgi:hypothetical protein